MVKVNTWDSILRGLGILPPRTPGNGNGQGQNHDLVEITPFVPSISPVSTLIPNVLGTDGEVNASVYAAATIVTAAANTMRVQSILTVSSTITGIEDAMNEVQARWKNFAFEIQYWSNTPFSIVPFALLTENGESITSTDYNGINIGTAILNATPAQNKVIETCPLCVARADYSSGTIHYSARVVVDLSRLSEQYNKYYIKKEMAEELPAVLQLGHVLIAQASSTVNYQTTLTTAYQVIPRSVPTIL